MRYWKKLNPDKSINTVESHSYDHEVKDFVEITEKEYNAFIDSMPEPAPEPVPRNLAAEIDAIKSDIQILKEGGKSWNSI